MPLRLIRYAILVGIVAYAMVCGFIGLDFGYHWDEPQTLRCVISAVESGVVLPSLYLYPSVNFIVPLAVLAPTAMHSIITKEPFPARSDTVMAYTSYQIAKPPTGTVLDRLQSALTQYIRSKHYLLQVRAVYLFLSLLVGIWVYLLLWHWRKRQWEALLGAALISLSWEFGYHARWVTPDALMTSFVLLSVMCVYVSQSSHRSRWWLAAAAVFAGVATGTKYQGGIALFPVLIAVLRDERPGGNHRLPWRSWGKLAAVFGITYLITTPGTLLDPLRFAHDLWFQITTYANGWEDHTVGRGPEHLAKLILYFALSAFSHFRWLAATVFCLSVVGAITTVRENRWDAAILVALPLLYTLYMAMQRVMFVRNDLVVIPFLAILAARGATDLLSMLAHRPVVRMLGIGMIATILCINGVWLWHAARTISVREFARYRYPSELLNYLQRNQSTRFALSTQVSSELRGLANSLPLNTVGTLDSAKYGVLYASEVTDPNEWDATHFDYTKTWFGPDELNFNYYPSWKGEDRIVVLRASYAAGLTPFKQSRARAGVEAQNP